MQINLTITHISDMFLSLVIYHSNGMQNVEIIKSMKVFYTNPALNVANSPPCPKAASPGSRTVPTWVAYVS